MRTISREKRESLESQAKRESLKEAKQETKELPKEEAKKDGEVETKKEEIAKKSDDTGSGAVGAKPAAKEEDDPDVSF